jgi:hypothetical protein
MFCRSDFFSRQAELGEGTGHHRWTDRDVPLLTQQRD